jgi:hypothetical protein
MALEKAFEQDLHACTCQLGRGASAVPQEGERVRVALIKDLQSWQDNKRVTIPAGTTYEGTATATDDEGFFDIVDDDGQRAKFYIHDSSLQVAVISSVPAQ